MELFANDGLLIPEQVWDGHRHPTPHGYARGEGTDSGHAPGLVARRIRQAAALGQRRPGVDRYEPVAARYTK